MRCYFALKVAPSHRNQYGELPKSIPCNTYIICSSKPSPKISSAIFGRNRFCKKVLCSSVCYSEEIATCDSSPYCVSFHPFPALSFRSLALKINTYIYIYIFIQSWGFIHCWGHLRKGFFGMNMFFLSHKSRFPCCFPPRPRLQGYLADFKDTARTSNCSEAEVDL